MDFSTIVVYIAQGSLLVVAALMTFFILLQEGKGGGLAGLGGTKAAGVEGVTNPIRRATGYLAALWFLLAIALGVMAKGSKSLVGSSIYDSSGKLIEKKTEEEKTPGPMKIVPTKPGMRKITMPAIPPAGGVAPVQGAPAIPAPAKADEKAPATEPTGEKPAAEKTPEEPKPATAKPTGKAAPAPEAPRGAPADAAPAAEKQPPADAGPAK